MHNISTPAAATLYFQYDRQGNITTRGSDQYVFDMANRMTAATGKATYVYDGLGRRVSTVKSDQSKQIHVYTQDGVLVMSTNQVGTGAVAETRYAYLNGSQIAELGIAFIHTDGLRSPVARVDGNRVVLSRTRYEPYGLTAAGATPTVGFTGHVNDANTGLVYMQQRYYDPVAARFLSIDPVFTNMETGDSFNRYAYAINNPYTYIDPDGRQIGRVIVNVIISIIKSEVKQGAKGAAKEGVKSAERRAVEGVKEGAKESAKRGPKTDPNAPHNAKIREEADKIEANGGEILAGGGRKPEVLIPTPGCIKSGRRPDIISRDADGNLSATNVGRVKADGTPVKREVEAASDLNGPGQLPTNFVPYH